MSWVMTACNTATAQHKTSDIKSSSFVYPSPPHRATAGSVMGLNGDIITMRQRREGEIDREREKRES